MFAQIGERGAADGVFIVSLVPTPAVLQRLRASQVCAVMIDGEVAQLPSIAVDHEPNSRQAVQHLLDLGHREIALIDRPEDPFALTVGSGRQRGYRRR